jgi:4-amino-4-deoxy-L-arabinose transferase-like glycosyltransferase
MPLVSEVPTAADDAVRAGGGAMGFLRSFWTGDTAPLRRMVAAIIALSCLRLALGLVLPLSFDEAYYWLWSRHLAAGYFDHPPAIAYAIRAGTLIFGDTPIGVRAVPLLCSFIASWAVWQSAVLLLGEPRKALLACLYFNLTLMVAVETMAATPDAMALTASALVVWALARLDAGDDRRWWLAVGAFGGLCLLSKYTGFFLGAGVLFWLLVSVRGRRWLVTPWPYLGGVLALLLFAPVIAWNAAHDWISFKFQFGRVATGGWTLRYLLEFVVAQALLASPFLLILGGVGVARASRFARSDLPVALCAALAWPAIVYFLQHSLHDRVQGNWPSFLFPAFAILMVAGATETWTNRFANRLVALSRVLAVPVAVVLLAVAYAQAFFAVAPIRDPVSRLAAFGFPQVAGQIENIVREQHTGAIVTNNYTTTAWLDFYLKTKIPIVQVNEGYRWLSAPVAPAPLAGTPLLFVSTEPKNGSRPDIVKGFTVVQRLASIDRRRRGILIEKYDVYAVSGWRGGILGRVP